ncbi:efflux RND transporter periplasmic adaptor subunit [Rhodoferax sp.]|uniref:efflux RND transporter periplasmic adaptor subunit n=1 Tax=Rhodoferax sp. TaxID=50421 RepID=UPI00374CD1A3
MRIPFFSTRPTAAWVAVSTVAVVLAACGEAPHGPATAHGTPQVGFVVLEPQRVALTTELPGRTSPVLIADVRPQISGLVQARGFTEGSDVKAGELLYQIDPATYRASADSAQAALAKAEANLVSVKLKAGRYKELVAIKAVSQQDADDAAASQLQTEADVASAKAALQTAKINLDYTRIVSPIAGRIGKSTVTQGALVTANQADALATVQKLNPIYVDVTQSSSALLALKRALAQGKLSNGTAKVKLLLEDGSPYPLEGKLQFSGVTVDQSTGAITLRAEFPNPKADLLPGMYVRAVVEEGVMDQALLVPQPAVSRDTTGKPIAYVVNADGKLEQRNITTDRAIGNQWLVSSGLKAGDKLVVEGQQKARPGAAVDAKPMVVNAAANAVASAQ